jgi:hypothetical protein
MQVSLPKMPWLGAGFCLPVFIETAMTEKPSQTRYWILGSILLMGISAAYIAPHDASFLGNFAWYWFPAAGVVSLLAAAGAKSGVLAGCSLALTTFLFTYHFWVQSLHSPGGLVWLGYLFAMPGAIAGALFAYFWFKNRNTSLMLATLVATSCTVFGLVLNMSLICSTVMYCGG